MRGKLPVTWGCWGSGQWRKVGNQGASSERWIWRWGSVGLPSTQWLGELSPAFVESCPGDGSVTSRDRPRDPLWTGRGQPGDRGDVSVDEGVSRLSKLKLGKSSNGAEGRGGPGPTGSHPGLRFPHGLPWALCGFRRCPWGHRPQSSWAPALPGGWLSPACHGGHPWSPWMGSVDGGPGLGGPSKDALWGKDRGRAQQAEPHGAGLKVARHLPWITETARHRALC